MYQVGTPGCDLNKNLGLDTASWVITSEGTIQTNNSVESKIEKNIQEGDIIVSKSFNYTKEILRRLSVLYIANARAFFIHYFRFVSELHI